MHISEQHLQALYDAYCNTHVLWESKAVFNLRQLESNLESSSLFLRKLNKPRRLGQLAEQFVFNQIETCDAAELIAENIQIQHHKHTIGELDALMMYKNQPIHLEIIYKFYVYDTSLGDQELERWIGPNRKDSLIEKLTKLKEKQLPLLYSAECKSTLEQLELAHFEFKQYVLFKAQLFTPYQQNANFKFLNKDCVCGFYIHVNQLEAFKTSMFYIPRKIDWFLEPHHFVDWILMKDFKNKAQVFLDNQQSPLFWIKTNSKLSKAFLVWW